MRFMVTLSNFLILFCVMRFPCPERETRPDRFQVPQPRVPWEAGQIALEIFPTVIMNSAKSVYTKIFLITI